MARRVFKAPTPASGKWQSPTGTVEVQSSLVGDYVDVSVSGALTADEAEAMACALLRCALLVRERQVVPQTRALFHSDEFSQPLVLASR